MSTTTETKMDAHAEFTVIARVTSIPLVASGINTLDGALSKNTFTRYPYYTAIQLSSSAIKYAEPFQARLSPLISKADWLANNAVDAVESRYPYPFQAKPEEVVSLIQEGAATYYNETTKKIDDNIKTPAINVAAGLDKRFSPLVDYYEVVVRRTSNSEAGPSTPPDAKYQYQRALALSRTLKDNIIVLSSEQLQQIRDQHAILQRAADAAKAINELAATSAASASNQIHKAEQTIHETSNNMIKNLQILQQHTASFAASIKSSVQDSATQLQNHIPPQIHQSYEEVTNTISAAITELKKIAAAENVSMQEKLGQAAQEVQNRVNPALEPIKRFCSNILSGADAQNSSHGAPPRGS
ncbi:hypothetical protein H0H87_007002 [Tephrocybe sp. NHM501043]|nr:hypothetical protein H0H87_007002 [Tephrocybe sp. NHM501043]